MKVLEISPCEGDNPQKLHLVHPDILTREIHGKGQVCGKLVNSFALSDLPGAVTGVLSLPMCIIEATLLILAGREYGHYS